MKFLTLSLFAVLCVSTSLEQNDGKIGNYNLSVKPEENNFTGKLILTINKATAEPAETFRLKVHPSINIKSCTYTDKQNSSRECRFDNHEGYHTYHVSGIKDDTVTIDYEGKYAIDGLYCEKLNDKDYCFANFGDSGPGKVLPFYEEEATFTLDWKRENQVIKDNIDRIKNEKEILNLNETAFVVGTWEHDESNDSQFLEFWPGPNTDMTTMYKNVSDNVMKKFKELFWEKSRGKVLQIILPHAPVRDIRRNYLTTQSNRNSILNDNIGAFTEQSIRKALIQELSQQWFGNEFISKDKWLNSGISTFLSYYLLDKDKTEECKNKTFSALNQFVVDEMQFRAFEADAFPSTLPLSKFNEIITTYDGVIPNPILYSKGASIMKYLYTACQNEEKFLDNLKLLLELKKSDVKEFAEKFKDCLQGTDPVKFFEEWHKNPGYPVLHVETVNATAGIFNLTQEPFSWTNTSINGSWILKIDYKTSKGKTGSTWMTTTSLELDINAECDWIIFNFGRNGYYRVNYDMKMWNAIISQLEKDDPEINEVDRAQIIDDIFSFARSVKKYSQPTPDYKMAFRLFNYLKREKNYIPLKAAFNAIDFLDSALTGGQSHAPFRSKVKAVVEVLYEAYPVTSQKTDHLEKLLVREVASQACKLDHEKCKKAAEEFFNQQRKTLPENGDQNKPNLSNVEDILLSTAVKNNENNWQFLFSKLKNENNTLQILTYINALGSIKNDNCIKSLLNTVFEKTNMENYRFEIFSSVLNGNPGNLKIPLKILEDNKNKISEYAIEKIVWLSSRKLNKKTGEELLDFVKKVLPKGNTVQSELETVVDTIKTWEEQKVSNINYLLTKDSGESRIKPIAFIITLSAILPLVNYFSK